MPPDGGGEVNAEDDVSGVNETLRRWLEAGGHWGLANASDASTCLSNTSSSSSCSLNATDSSLFDTPAPPFSLPSTIFIGVCLTLCIVITVCGNILVLMAFICERAIRQPSNYFLASLAVTDILIGTVSMPFYTVYVLVGYWDLGPILCDLWLSVDYTVCLVSQFTVLLITIDRFCSVKIAAKYRSWRTKNRVIIMVLVTWVIPALLFFVSIFGWEHFIGYRDLDPGECMVQFLKDPIFNTSLIVAYYWIPLIVLFVLYAGIYQTAWEMSKKAREKRKQAQAMMMRPPAATASARPSPTPVPKSVGRESEGGKKSGSSGGQGGGDGQCMTVSRTQSTLFSQDKAKPVTEESGAVAKSNTTEMTTHVDKVVEKDFEKSSSGIESEDEKRDSNSSLPKVVPPPPTRECVRNDSLCRAAAQCLLDAQDSGPGLAHPIIQPIPADSAAALLGTCHTSNGDLPNGLSAVALSSLDDLPIVPPPPSVFNHLGVNPLAASTPLSPSTTAMIEPIAPPAMFADLPHLPRPNSLDLKVVTTPTSQACDSVMSMDLSDMRFMDESSVVVPSPVRETPPSSTWTQHNGNTTPEDMARCLDGPTAAASPSNTVTPTPMPSYNGNSSLCNGSDSRSLPKSHSSPAKTSSSAEPSPPLPPHPTPTQEPSPPPPLSQPSVKKQPPTPPSRDPTTTLAPPILSVTPSNQANDCGKFGSPGSNLEKLGEPGNNLGKLGAPGNDRGKLGAPANGGPAGGGASLTASTRGRESSIEVDSCPEQPSDEKTKPKKDVLRTLGKKMRLKKNKRDPEDKKSKSHNRANKALRTISVIMGAFVACWTPYHIIAIMESFCLCTNGHVYMFFYFLCYANSPINPFCYALANQQFKKTFTRLLRGDFHVT